MTEAKSSAREVAVRVIYQIFEKRAFTNLELDKALFSCELNHLDKKLATEIVYGTVKYKNHIDHILSFYLNKPLAKADAWTRQILRMSVYQLIFLDRVPPHAIVNEAVKLSRVFTKPQKRQDKFINGVLRNIVRKERKVLWPDRNKDFRKYISLYESYPLWLVDLWLDNFSQDEVEKLAKWFNRTPYMWARLNSLKCDRENLKILWQQEGLSYSESPQLTEAFIIKDSNSVRGLASFQNGLFSLQDLSSMYVAHALKPESGDEVLDCCAAPGGKSTHLASLMKNDGVILATDIHPHRVSLIKEASKRLGADIVETKVQDATRLPIDWTERFDKVLVDAPCSGLGVLHRRADARWHREEAAISELVALQRQILENAARTVKKDGVLVYSTCTMIPAENEAQCDWFLENHPNFMPDALPNLFQPYLNNAPHMACFSPLRDGMDGFFVARFKRRN